MAGRRHTHAGAVRRRLRARESRHHVARAARRVSRTARPRVVVVLPRAAADPVRRRADERRCAARRRADARTLQRDLLRACLPCAAARLSARRGRRPDGARRARLPEDRLGSPARPRDPSPSRRRLLRSARDAARFDAGDSRPRAGVARGDTCSSPTRSA